MKPIVQQFTRGVALTTLLLTALGFVQSQAPSAHAGTCTAFVKASNNSSTQYQLNLWWDGSFPSAGCQSAKATTHIINSVTYPQSDAQIWGSTGGTPTVLEDTGYHSGDTTTGWWAKSCSANSNNVSYQAYGGVKDSTGFVLSENTAIYNRCQ